MNPPQVYMFPHPEHSSLLPPHTIPLGRPSAPAPSIQYCASNLDWRLVSYMILYMFQCHSPKSSHPLPLPLSPKDCSIHQCLFCCLLYRVIVTIFLNSIYMRQYTVLVFSFWLTSLCIISCMKRVASPGSMHNTGCLGLVHWDDPEQWYGEGGGRRVQHGEHCIPVVDSFRYLAKLIQYCKV